MYDIKRQGSALGIQSTDHGAKITENEKNCMGGVDESRSNESWKSLRLRKL